ncbi:YkgJ family cysteine cluster protein [Chroococcidiopsis sp.]|uniref:YkgJ family cysteine cluster protein n=1 Tax=Chroococcidiopsis sp. TaxID=3088168 RepID=UPI003F2F7B8A
MSQLQLAELEEIYNSLPLLVCKGKCQECCGVIGVLPIEVENIQTVSSVPTVDGDLTCSKLVQGFGICSIYKQRPLICRLWGIAEEMPCPYGCKPERTIGRKEANKLIAKIQALKKGKQVITIHT